MVRYDTYQPFAFTPGLAFDLLTCIHWITCTCTQNAPHQLADSNQDKEMGSQVDRDENLQDQMMDISPPKLAVDVMNQQWVLELGQASVSLAKLGLQVNCLLSLQAAHDPFPEKPKRNRFNRSYLAING